MTTPEPVSPAPGSTSKTGHVVIAPAAIREAVDRTKATLLAASTSTVASLDGGHRIPVDHLWCLVDTATALLEHDCPEPAVSPAPDTEALRQQVAHALNEAIGGQLDGGASLATATDAVLALPWIKYAAGQKTVVTMYERNNAAIAETNRQFAEENAGLRADLDQARRAAGEAVVRQNVLRSERDKAQQQVSRLTLAALDTCGGTPEQVAEQVTAAEAAIRKARDVRDSMAAESWAEMRAERDQARAEVERLTAELLMVPRANDTVIAEVVEAVLAAGDWNGGIDAARRVFRERAELARVSGARTIPDDAAERVADALRDVRLNLGPNALEAIYGGANHLILSGGERQAIALTAIKALGLSTPTAGYRIEAGNRLWLCDVCEARVTTMAGPPLTNEPCGHSGTHERLSTPTTDPAPAAADGERPKRSEWLCPNCKKPPTPFGDDQDWMCDEHRSTPPAAPQAPVEPTATPDDDYGDDIRPPGPLAPIRHEEG